MNPLLWPLQAGLPGRIDIAHPEEFGPLLVVLLAALGVIYLLLRITLTGARALGKNARLPVKPYRRVLLPAAPGMGYSKAMVALACRLAAASGAGSGGGQRGGPASVLLTFILEVPRSLAPDAPMPEAEAQAQRALAEAAEVVKRCGLLPIPQIRKGRATVEETLRAIKDENADLLVLMVPPSAPDAGAPPDPLADLTAELARRAPCEVVLARSAAQ